MTHPTILTRGFCAPILWGVRHGYAVDEIAAGLGLDITTVVQAIELNSGVQFPPRLRRSRRVRIDLARTDKPYRDWLRAKHGAAAALGAGGAHG